MLRKSLVDLLSNKDKSFNNTLDLSIFKLNNQSFINLILECIPEAGYLNTKANASAEKQGESKATKNFYGLSEDEAIRGFSGLLRFKEVMNHSDDDYKNFVNCQIEMKKPVLQKTSFDDMKEHIMQTLKTPADFAAEMWSILCNDLGKVHEIIHFYHMLRMYSDPLIGHDALLAEMLDDQPQLFPGFKDLPEKHRQQIIAGYASGCDISMLEQLELPANALKALAKLDKETLERYILHTIYDVSGAAAVYKQNGSLTMHEETWTLFNELRRILAQLHQEKSPSLNTVYENYLTFRGKCVGLTNEGPESVALMRIAGLARLATKEHGELLKSAWNELTQEERSTLISELNVRGGEEGRRAIFVGYGVVMLVNPQIALKSEYGTVINKEGLKIGLKYLAHAFMTTRKEIGNDFSRSDQLFVAECAAIASALSKNPREFVDGDQLTKEFKAMKKTDRRIDYTLVNPSLDNKVEQTQPSLAKIGMFTQPAIIFDRARQTLELPKQIKQI